MDNPRSSMSMAKGFCIGIAVMVGAFYLLAPSAGSYSASSLEVEEMEIERLPPAPPTTTTTAAPTIVRRSCLQGDTSDAYYTCRRAELLRGCSEICDTNILGTPAKHFNFASKHVDCNGIWMNEETDASLGDGQWPPPDYPPPTLLADYEQEGRVQVVKNTRYAERFLGSNHPQWTEALVEQMVVQARAGTLHGTYGPIETNSLRESLKEIDLKGKRVLVIGSAGAWVEACALEAGAGEVWTLEYGKIDSTHPKVFTMTPEDARLKYIAGTLPKFDAVVTYSSVEHSGLGRFGDALNPWGDMQAIARAWCITKPGGLLVLAVIECGPTDKDSIQFNMHRCYRNYAYTHLTANWEQIYRGPTHTGQPVQIFRRAEAPARPRGG